MTGYSHELAGQNPKMENRMLGRQLRRTAAAAATCLAASPAWAHHVMGGKLPATFSEGLWSGLGHPIIGPEHLGFLLAIGIVVGAGGLNLALCGIFLAAMAIGVAVHVSGFGIPAAEILVALSALLAGLLIARGHALPLLAWSALFVIAGFFHGYAFGESIAGAEQGPLTAYLFGLVIVQSALAVGAALITRRLGVHVNEMVPRLAGAVIIGIGFAALIGQLVPAV
jgi:urease accessory protein